MNIIGRAVESPVPFLNKIIDDEKEFPPFHNAMRAKQNIVAMDVGCGFPMALILLNEKYNLTKAICVDEAREEEIVQEVLLKLHKAEFMPVKSISDLYFQIMNGRIKTKEDFDEIFLKHSFWGISAEYAIMKNRKNNERVDVLICQNFLHLWEEKAVHETWLSDFSLAIKDDALVVLSIEAKPWFDYKEFKTTLQIFFDGTLFEFYINGSWRQSYFFNL